MDLRTVALRRPRTGPRPTKGITMTTKREGPVGRRWRRVVVAVLAALATTAAAVGVVGVGPAAAATGAITGYGGKCVDVAGASTANGTAVQLYDCNGTAAQQWTVGTDGTIRALGKCLDVAGSGHRQRHPGPAVGLQRHRSAEVDRRRGARPREHRRRTSCLDATGQHLRQRHPAADLGPAPGGANQKWTAAVRRRHPAAVRWRGDGAPPPTSTTAGATRRDPTHRHERRPASSGSPWPSCSATATATRSGTAAGR